jgi:hypothetical protein
VTYFDLQHLIDQIFDSVSGMIRLGPRTCGDKIVNALQ